MSTIDLILYGWQLQIYDSLYDEFSARGEKKKKKLKFAEVWNSREYESANAFCVFLLLFTQNHQNRSKTDLNQPL